MKYSWIVLKHDVQPWVFLCERCKQSHPITMPVPIDMVIAMGKSFVKTHKRCIESKEE